MAEGEAKGTATPESGPCRAPQKAPYSSGLAANAARRQERGLQRGTCPAGAVSAPGLGRAMQILPQRAFTPPSTRSASICLSICPPEAVVFPTVQVKQ